MDIRGMSVTQFALIAHRVGADRYADNVKLDLRDHSTLKIPGARGRILVKSSREAGARRSWSGRRMPAACWHLTRDVLAAAFDVNPDLRVHTMMARYIGRDGFNDLFPDTANHNIGSIVSPAYMPELCECDGEIRDNVYRLDVAAFLAATTTRKVS